VGDSDHYLDLSREEVNQLARRAGIDLPENPKLPFWDAVGGKLAAIAGIVLLACAKSGD
jgi:hypothetical protein